MEYNNLLSQYRAISDLVEGQKLEADSTTNILRPSIGNNTTWGGWLVQSSSRAAGNLYGSSQSDWKSISNIIDKMIKDTPEILESSTSSQSFRLIGLICLAKKKIGEMARETYQNKIGAKEAFETLAEKMESLCATYFLDKDFDGGASKNTLEATWDVSHGYEDHNEGIDVNNIPRLTTAGPVRRVINTAISYGYGILSPESKEGSYFPLSGEQMSNKPVNSFMQKLVENYPINSSNSNGNDLEIASYVDNFTRLGGEINNFTLEQAEAIINHLDLKAQPICMPLVLEGKEAFSRNHIVAILIKDNKIEYFDSLGIPSHEVMLANKSGTLADFLKFCEKKFHLNEILEKNVQLQNDIHSCGIFVCNFFNRRLKEQEIMGMTPLAISQEQLIATVNEMSECVREVEEIEIKNENLNNQVNYDVEDSDSDVQ
jgi:hypothetical protein